MEIEEEGTPFHTYTIFRIIHKVFVTGILLLLLLGIWKGLEVMGMIGMWLVK